MSDNTQDWFQLANPALYLNLKELQMVEGFYAYRSLPQQFPTKEPDIACYRTVIRQET
jgi:hypothetical protein